MRDNDEYKEARESIANKSRFKKELISFLLRKGYFSYHFFQYLFCGMNPFNSKKDLIEHITGLRTNTIIGNPLYYPDVGENEGKLRFQNARAGLWNSYDFRKGRKLYMNDLKTNIIDNVDFLFFPLENAFINSMSDKGIETPEGFLDFLYLDHLIYFSKFKIKEALDYGAIEEVSYEEAYSKVGIASFQKDIKELGIGTKTVYQVTPKGNTLIIPIGKGGDKTPPLPKGVVETKGILQPIKSSRIIF